MKAKNSRRACTNRYDEAFWAAVDSLVTGSEIVIDRPKGTAHPRYPSLIYPVDYGYWKGTTSMDGAGIDVWVGTAGNPRASAIICTVDVLKKDSEIKILIGCTEAETEMVYETHNGTAYMHGVLIRR